MELLVFAAIAVVVLVTYMGFNPREPPHEKVEMAQLLLTPPGEVMRVVQMDLGPDSEDDFIDWNAGYDTDFSLSADSTSDEI